MVSVKVLVYRNLGASQPQTRAGSGNLQQLVFMLARQFSKAFRHLN